MLSSIIRFKYPQVIWSDNIFYIIKKNKIEEHIDNIYDIPGGAGFVAYNLSLKINKNYYVIDIENKKINFANKYLKSNKITYRIGNLFYEKFQKKSLWLLVNSFYLLDNISQVIKLNSKQVEYIVGIFPYVDTKNYLFFKKKIDTNLNVNEMDKISTIKYFEKNGYSLIDTKDTIYFNYLTYPRYLNIVLSPILFFYEKIFKPYGNIYWVGLFKRK
jgi:hypothetical protein